MTLSFFIDMPVSYFIDVPELLFIEVSVPNQKSEWSCICVRGIDFASVSTIFQTGVWNCSNSVVFLVFNLIICTH